MFTDYYTLLLSTKVNQSILSPFFTSTIIHTRVHTHIHTHNTLTDDCKKKKQKKYLATMLFSYIQKIRYTENIGDKRDPLEIFGYNPNCTKTTEK